MSNLVLAVLNVLFVHALSSLDQILEIAIKRLHVDCHGSPKNIPCKSFKKRLPSAVGLMILWSL